MTQQHNSNGGHIPTWVVQEIGRLQLELIVAQARIRELENEISRSEGGTEVSST